MKIEPAGHRVIVKPDPLSEIEQKELAQYQALQASGFEISDQKDKKRKEQAVHTGVIVAIGKTAWKAFDDGMPWAAVGDRVHFAKYGGYVFSEDRVEYRLLNDEDITAILREGSDATPIVEAAKPKSPQEIEADLYKGIQQPYKSGVAFPLPKVEASGDKAVREAVDFSPAANCIANAVDGVQ